VRDIDAVLIVRELLESIPVEVRAAGSERRTVQPA